MSASSDRQRHARKGATKSPDEHGTLTIFRCRICFTERQCAAEIPRGQIKKITFGPEFTWNEFVIVSAKDIPGKNYIALIENDQPCLADGVVNHPEEPILLLAHPDRHALPKAVEAVRIEYDSLPAIFTIEESEKRSEIVWGEDNTSKRI